jgi:hypothetical protein
MTSAASSTDQAERYTGRAHFSDSIRNGERRPLLAENGDERPASNVQQPLYSCVSNLHSDLHIYTSIHRIRRDVTSVVEDYLSLTQLRDVRMNITVVRPLVDKLYELDDISIGER